MRNYIILGVIAVLMVVGGLWNYQRERSGLCSEGYVADYLLPELTAAYFKESNHMEDLQAALKDSRITASDRSSVESQIATIEAELANGAVSAREISPSSRLNKTCLARLDVNDGYIQARFKLTAEPIPGSEFEEKYSKRRKNVILLEDLEPGKVYDSVEVAVFGRRSFHLEEKPFPGIAYSQAFTPEEAVTQGVVSDIPK